MKGKFDYRSLLLLIIPIILFLVGFLYLKNSGYFFLNCVDPDYAYLFNGILFADLHTDVSYIDHPGIPIQFLIAIIIRIVKLFRPGMDMVSDVIKNPEIYIHAIINTINFLGTSLVFVMGLITFKKTGNIFLALIMQLIPFVHRLGMEPMARLIPESLLLSLICIWMIVFIQMATDTDLNRRMKKYSVVLGIIFGLGLANKLTFLPFAVFPFFILYGWKNRLRFTAISIVAFFAFAFPVFFKYKSFYIWVRNLIFGTVRYGTRETGILSMQEFTGHLKMLLQSMPFLVISFLILILAGVIFFIKTGRKDPKDRLYTNAALGLILVVILQFVITAKQFSFHYMLPSILLTFPMIFLSFIMLRRVFATGKMQVFLTAMLSLIIIIILSDFIPNVRTYLKQMEKRNTARMESYLQLKKSRSLEPMIISVSYYGCSSVEYALTFGIHLSEKYGDYLTSRLKELYPSTYLYFPWSKTFYEGNREILPSAFLEPEKKYDLFIADYTPERFKEILNALGGNMDSVRFETMPVYIHTSSGEALYTLQTKNK